MLSENLKAIRKSKGLSQEELAAKVNVVRQTVSKWEQGLSVPDSDLLVALSDALETPVSVLIGETVEEKEPDDLKAIAQKLEVINLQLSQSRQAKRNALHWTFIVLTVIIIIAVICLFTLGSPYLNWDMNDPETVVIGSLWHAFEWGFGRIFPFLLIGTVTGAILTRKK